MSQRKNPENPRSNFSTIVGNFQLFPGKMLFSQEKSLLFQKNDLF